MILFNHTNEKSLVIFNKQSYRGCIVTLIRSDNLVSLNKLLNMLNSLRLYFKNIDYYTIYLFHESTLTYETKKQILYCSSKLKIKFYEIYFNVIIPSNRSGYASMCQFWSYDIWFKYNYLKNQCDYVMRFDDDSYLINFTQYDLFEEFHKNQLDYAYRIIYHDNNGLDFLQKNLEEFLPKNQTRRSCIQSLCTNLNGPYGYDGLAIYNNFFIIRLNLIYENSIIEKYLKQLISINAFYRYRIGDANVQTICLLLIEKPLKVSFFKFPYNHNAHGSLYSHPSFIFYEGTSFMWHYQMKIPNITCNKLFIATKYNLIMKNL
ncbi:unnamed protein product [Rotaria sp. Silwood1]|nr:unnamed protein product [Rotaria sp. Silwood1]CAF3743001.1 unnamed protein product [Rotaria sp. Silwood1]CAF4639881.1 unnamed protein product [Rotaria sp. Silwood1]